MKYYSQDLKKFYDSEKECLDAERAYQKERDAEKKEREKKASERKAKAAEVEAARKAMIVAQKKYKETLDAFVKEYGSYHLSLRGDDAKDAMSLFDIFDPFRLF